MKDEILTVTEVSNYLKIPPTTLYKLAREGVIPSVKVGRHWRFKKTKLESWWKRQEKIARKDVR